MPSKVVVTCTFNDPSAVLQGNSFLRLRLRSYQGFIPRVLGTAVLAETQIDSAPDSSGDVSVSVWGNDNIDPTGTFYTAEFWNGGRITSSGNFLITGAAYDLDSAPIVNPPALPANVTLQGIPQYTLLQNDGVDNDSQSILDLISSRSADPTSAGGNILVEDNGSGAIELFGPEFYHDSTLNTYQGSLSVDGPGAVTVTDNGAGHLALDVPGVPALGTTGQVLTKNSNTAYDTSWQTPSGGGSGVVLQATVTMSAADINSNNFVSLIAAPGSGKGIVVSSVAMRYKHGTVGFGSTAHLTVYTTNSTTGRISWFGDSGSGITLYNSTTADNYFLSAVSTLSGTDEVNYGINGGLFSHLDNAPIQGIFSGANGSGNGTLVLVITYYVVDLN